MAIEFSCPHCGKVLKTKDEKAGLSAKCPDCGGTVTVPSEPSGPDSWEGAAAVGVLSEGDNDLGAAPDESEIGAEMKDCPMCGKSIRASAKICRYCGERFGGGGPIRPTRVQPNDVINASWKLFKEHGVQVVVAFLVTVGIQALLGIVGYAGIIAIVVGMGAGNGPPDQGMIIAIVAVAVPFVIVFFLVAVYMNLGMAIFCMNVAKGRDPQLGDLFTGGPIYGTGLLGSLIVGLIFMVIYGVSYGPMFAVLLGGGDPALMNLLNLLGMAVYYLSWGYLQMRVTPWMYHAVDKRAGAIDSLKLAWEITSVNHVSQLVVVPVMAVALYLLGLLMCCFGIFVTFAFYTLMQAVAYLLMSGRSVAYSD